jgi:predicted dehydrogenase
MDDTQIVACCNRSIDKARAMASRHGIGEAFDNVPAMLDAVAPDVLNIITPPETHLATIRMAAERGINAICQKAFCTSLAEAREAAAVAEATGIEVIVHENFRFQPWHREAKRRLTAGHLGELYQVTFRLRPGDGQGPNAYLERQPYFQQMPRFLVHETAIHLVDTFRFLFGEIRSVYADLRRLNPVIAGEDAGLILFDFCSGTRGVFDGNRLVDHKARNRRLTMGEMLIEGAAGVLRLDGEAALYFRTHGSNDEQPITYSWQDKGFGGDCVYATQANAVSAFLGRQPAENKALDYLRNLMVEEAIYQSATEGRRIEIEN